MQLLRPRSPSVIHIPSTTTPVWCSSECKYDGMCNIRFDDDERCSDIPVQFQCRNISPPTNSEATKRRAREVAFPGAD